MCERERGTGGEQRFTEPRQPTSRPVRTAVCLMEEVFSCVEALNAIAGNERLRCLSHFATTSFGTRSTFNEGRGGEKLGNIVIVVVLYYSVLKKRMLYSKYIEDAGREDVGDRKTANKS